MITRSSISCTRAFYDILCVSLISCVAANTLLSLKILVEILVACLMGGASASSTENPCEKHHETYDCYYEPDC